MKQLNALEKSIEGALWRLVVTDIVYKLNEIQN
jgi:hypothetical protein